MLNAREPKVVNGPEILNKYVGASEENVRKLFEDAEKEASPHRLSVVVETNSKRCCSIRRRVTRVACTLSFSTSWMLSSNSVVQQTVGPAWVTLLSTSFCQRYSVSLLEFSKVLISISDGWCRQTEQYPCHWYDEQAGHD